MKHDLTKYSKATADYIDRWERAIFQAPYVWNEEKIMEALKGFYLALKKEFPENYKIKKLKDIFDNDFLRTSAFSASSAASATSPYSAYSAYLDSFPAASAYSAFSASSAYLTSSAYLASLASSAYLTSLASLAFSVPLASLAPSASSASSAYLALFSFEYYQKKNKLDDKGKMFLDSQFSMLEALENGLGYFAERDGLFYLVPAPIVRLNERNQKHSETDPAVEWKEGKKFYYLEGIKFEKELWEKVVKRELSAKDCIAIENIDQRAIALRYFGWDKVIEELGAKKISEDEYGEMFEVDLRDDTKPARFVKAIDPSTGEPIFDRCHPDCKTPKEANERHYRLALVNEKYEDFLRI